MEVSEKVFLVNFSSSKFWDVNSNYLKLTNFCKWNTRKLSELVDVRIEEASKEEIDSQKVLLLERISFNEGKVFAGNKIQTRMKQFKGYAGDIVVSKINARKGAIGIVEENLIVGSTIHFRTLIPKPDTNTIFLWLALRSPYCRNQFQISTGGQGKGEISEERLLEVEVPYPPKHIQQKIVDFWKKAEQQYSNAVHSINDLIDELHEYLVKQTRAFKFVTSSKMFVAKYSQTQQWDVKAGRAAAFIVFNPSFIRLGDFTEECTETVKPWDEPQKHWLIYGVNNKDGVFLSSKQLGKDFNAPYKKIKKDWFFHNPTRANVGSLGIVPEVPSDAITSPEYQVWRLTREFLPDFMALLFKTDYFLELVSFNRVGGVKQRMYYANLAEIRLPKVPIETQSEFVKRYRSATEKISTANTALSRRTLEIDQMILGIHPVEEN